jgi:hypothetical protein
MVKESNFKILCLFNKCQLKYIFFTVILSSLFWFYESFAIDETNEIPNNNNNSGITSDFNFSNITNITNNKHDSVYAQIASIDNHLYLIWQESVGDDKPKETNYEIYFKKSVDNGNTFSNQLI